VLRLLVDLAQGFKQAGKGWSMGDLGCGSGILAIAAKKLGADPVWGCDFDPKAVQVSNENALRNGVAEVPFEEVDVLRWKPKRSQQWDVVAANLFADILENAFPTVVKVMKPNGVVLLDSHGRIEWANLTAANQLGFDPQRDVGQYVRNLVRQPEFSQYIKQKDFEREVQIEGPGARAGQSTQISVQIHPYGKKRKLMLSRDVTAVQLAEAMRRDFVANVSHEIRTPLTVLSGFVETMQTVPFEDADRQR
jgi:signal transduction histidine kinase